MVQTVPDGIGTLMSLEELQIAYVEHEEAEPSLRQFVKELANWAALGNSGCSALVCLLGCRRM